MRLQGTKLEPLIAKGRQLVAATQARLGGAYESAATPDRTVEGEQRALTFFAGRLCPSPNAESDEIAFLLAQGGNEAQIAHLADQIAVLDHSRGDTDALLHTRGTTLHVARRERDTDKLPGPTAETARLSGAVRPLEVTSGDEFCRTHRARRVSCLEVNVGADALDVLGGFSRMLEKQRIDLLLVKGVVSSGTADLGGFLEPIGYSPLRHYGDGAGESHAGALDMLFVSQRAARRPAIRSQGIDRRNGDGAMEGRSPADAALPYLERSGWTRSRELRRPVDVDGAPLPWYTYPAISFLQGRLTADMAVFEFGCGNSTLWWGARVANVTSVEHNQGWTEAIAQQLPPNCELLHRELETDGEYARSVTDVRQAPFAIVVIDGRDRVNSARHSLAALRDDGVVVWDNSERARYRPGFDLLGAAGFRRLDFHGHGPINAREWTTTVFYRPDNCLGI